MVINRIISFSFIGLEQDYLHTSSQFQFNWKTGIAYVKAIPVYVIGNEIVSQKTSVRDIDVILKFNMQEVFPRSTHI